MGDFLKFATTQPVKEITPFETVEERRARKKEAKRAAHEEALRKETEAWDPSKNPAVTSDSYKTLFVGRLPYTVTEKKIRQEFEEYGPIKSVHLVYNSQTGKFRGYCFIEFEHEKDMKSTRDLFGLFLIANAHLSLSCIQGR